MLDAKSKTQAVPMIMFLICKNAYFVALDVSCRSE